GVTRQAPGSGECPGARHRGGRGPGAPGLPSGRLANPTPPPRPPPNTRLLLPPPHPLQSAAIIESVKFLYTAAQQKRRSLGGEPHSPLGLVPEQLHCRWWAPHPPELRSHGGPPPTARPSL